MFRRGIREVALGATQGATLALDTSPELRRCAPLLRRVRLSARLNSYRRRKRLLYGHALLCDALKHGHIFHSCRSRSRSETGVLF